MRILVAPVLAAALAGTLTGCAVPPVLSVAGLIVDGVSFAATGRTMTDHALSIATEEDCKLFRVVDGAPICQPAEDGLPSLAEVPTVEIDGQIIAVSYDYPASDPSDAAPASLGPAREARNVEIASLDPASALAGLPVPATLPVPALADDLGNAPATGSRAVASRMPLPGSKPPARVSSRDRDLRLVLAGKALALKPAAPSHAQAVAGHGRDDDTTVVVVRSYHDRIRAERVAQGYRALGAEVAEGRVKGRAVYRVVVAVAPDDSPVMARERLARAGFRDAWLVNL